LSRFAGPRTLDRDVQWCPADLSIADRQAASVSHLTRSIVMPATLFERLGGEDGITRLVTDIVDNHYRNPLIRTRFEQIKDRAAVERHSVEFLCAGSGGPQAYTGRDLLSTHKGMNISEQELIAAIDDIVAAMTKNDLDPSVQNEVVAILYSLKGDVLRR
jgi:hemoglobin